jgi:hypothetical protein
MHVQQKLLIYLALCLIFGISSALAGKFPEPWGFIFGAGMLVGALTIANRHQGGGWRVSVLLCVAAGSMAGRTIFEYPVTEILGLYLAIAMLIAVSAWWWKLRPFSSAGDYRR